DGRRGGEPQHVLDAERLEPFRVATEFDAVTVDDPPELLEERLGVAIDLVLRQAWADRRPARRIADPGGEVPDDQHRDVAGVLELPELPEHHGPPERHGGGGRIQAQLDAEGPAEGQLLLQPALGSDLRGPALEPREGVGCHGAAMLPTPLPGTARARGTLRSYAEGPGTRCRRCRARLGPRGVQHAPPRGLP